MTVNELGLFYIGIAVWAPDYDDGHDDGRDPIEERSGPLSRAEVEAWMTRQLDRADERWEAEELVLVRCTYQPTPQLALGLV